MRQRLFVWFVAIGIPLFLMGGFGAFFIPEGAADRPWGIAVILSGVFGLLLAFVGVLIREPMAFFKASTLRHLVVTAIAFTLAEWAIRTYSF
ncbi:hypothetical protein BH11ARM2_BH11ARM2_03270 [soil metagenome]